MPRSSATSATKFLGESRAAKIQIDLPGKHTALEPGRVYLLPPFFAP